MGEKTKPLLNDAAVLRRKEFSKNWCVFQLNLQFKTLFCNRTHCQNACSLEKIETRRTLYSPWSFSMKSEVELYPVQQSKTVLLNAAICFSWALRKVECTAWSTLESEKAITALPFISAKLDSHWLVPDIVTRCESSHE